jgi:hypothetical protein
MAEITFLDEPIELASIAPRRFVKIMGRKQNRARRERSSVAKDSQGFDGGGDAGFHVGRTAARKSPVGYGGRKKGQMDRIQVSIELQRSTRFAGVVTHDDSGRGWMATCRPFDTESVLG